MDARQSMVSPISGCFSECRDSATSRKLTREEQDRINKTRKSVRKGLKLSHLASTQSLHQLMQFTSVKVTPEAQKAYLAKNPNATKNTAVASAAAGPSTAASTPPVPNIGKKRKSDQAELDVNSLSKKAKQGSKWGSEATNVAVCKYHRIRVF